MGCVCVGGGEGVNALHLPLTYCLLNFTGENYSDFKKAGYLIAATLTSYRYISYSNDLSCMSYEFCNFFFFF